MNFKYLFAFAAAAVMFAACEEKPEPKPDDSYIEVSQSKIEATWEGIVSEIEVRSNCKWTISKTDAEGVAVDWVKCNVISGENDMTIQVKVGKNDFEEERAAVVTLFNESAKAFIDVKQEGNPNATKPKFLELSFDFSAGGLDSWPTSKEADWSSLKNCDSGCATDNGGTATENSHRRAQVTFTLDGVGYDFTYADPNGAEKHNIYLDTAKGVYLGTLRFFGIPALAGKKIVKIEMVNNASNKDPEKFARNVGVAKWVFHKDVPVEQFQYVDGGEPQNQAATDGTVYTYELSGTAPNTIYWINATKNASIIKSLKLYYADADGTEEPLGQEPEDPKPADPGTDPGTDPGNDPGGNTDPGQEPDPNAITLSFPFTGEPLAGWPTAKYEHVEGGIECVYPLDGKDYIFVPADCGTATAGQAFWRPPVDGADGYFAFNAQYRYLGMPAIEGYTLIKVVCHNVKLSGSTITPRVGITTLINSTAAHPSDDAYVAGGQLQSWNLDGGEVYTYSLSGTAPNTRYYIYAAAKGAVSLLELTYNPAK